LGTIWCLRSRTMKRLMSLGAVFLILGLTIGVRGQERVGNDGVRDRFVGAWRLAWLEEQGADGKTHRADCSGLLVFTGDGHVSVEVMYRNPLAYAQAGPKVGHV